MSTDWFADSVWKDKLQQARHLVSLLPAASPAPRTSPRRFEVLSNFFFLNEVGKVALKLPLRSCPLLFPWEPVEQCCHSELLAQTRPGLSSSRCILRKTLVGNQRPGSRHGAEGAESTLMLELSSWAWRPESGLIGHLRTDLVTEFVTVVGELSGLLWNDQLRSALVRLGCGHGLGDYEFWDLETYSGSPRRGVSWVRV